MRRPVAIVGAPSSIGLRPDERSGEPQQVDRAPGILREHGVVEAARRRGSRRRGSAALSWTSRVRPAGRGTKTGSRPIVGRSRIGSRPVSSTVDSWSSSGAIAASSWDACSVPVVTAGRSDSPMWTPTRTSRPRRNRRQGSVASMGLALAVGHGDSPLARLADPAPLVRPEHVALIGRRDGSEPSYGHAALSVSGILDLPEPDFEPGGVDATASAALVRVGSSEVAGFWILVDADVLNPQVMPAVGSRRTGRARDRRTRRIPRPAGEPSKGTRHGTHALRPFARPAIGRARHGSWSCLSTSSDVRAATGSPKMRRLDIIGAPSSAGAYAPGQERAPEAIRAAGLLANLRERGIAVNDRGDVPGFRWRVDRANPRAMNAEAAAGVARAVAGRVAESLAEGASVLVLGGDCTVELGTVAGASVDTEDLGLDLHRS